MTRPLIKARALSPGQTIGLIAPSFALPKPEALSQAVTALETMGYAVKVGESCYSKHGYFAGPDALRVAELNAMFRDDSVDAILCARGGYGATRLLEEIDYAAIRKNPKLFSGYSDITALHSAILRHAGLITLHGLMACPDFGQEENDPFSLECFFRTATDPRPIGRLENPPKYPRETIAPGHAEGRLIGGNLALVTGCLGTPYAYDFDDAILFLEDVGEYSYAIDRMLTQLRRAGALGRVRGVLVGDFADCNPQRAGDFTLPEILRDCLGSLGKPVLAGIRCGHCTPKLTLPLGVMCRMDADAKSIEITEGAVV